MEYINSPIREAIFDIQVDEMKISEQLFSELYSQIASEYPEKNKQLNITNKIEFKDSVELKNESNSFLNGYIYSNTEKNVRLQVRKNGFTLNMLPPYSNWKAFSNEAFRLWEIYSTVFNIKEINRFALRYINKINIPLTFNTFQEYITNIPPIPNCLPQSFNNFFLQIDVPCKENGVNLILTETIEKRGNEVLPFILDIDVYKKGKIENNISNLKAGFEILRKNKNETFENCITDNTRNLFK